MRSRVLCFAPYSNYYELHGMWETTILQALRLRGAAVRYVLCDGMGEVCDLFRLAPGEKNCARCQAKSASFAASRDMDFAWLGRFLAPREFHDVDAWVESDGRRDLLAARFGSWEIGTWVTSSLNTYFREEQLDASRPEVRAAILGYLRTGLLTALAIRTLLLEFSPEVVFLFNGRFAMSRTTLEVAKVAGVPAYTHERGMLKETLSLGRDDIPMSRARFRALWRLWADTPLLAGECEDVRRFLDRKASACGDGWYSYSPAATGTDGLRQRLGIGGDDRIIAVYTSSTDEIVASLEAGCGAYDRHDDWLEATLGLLADLPGVAAVVRVHPNTGGRRAFGESRGAMAFLAAMQERFPGVRFIAPDADVSSYDLMAAAHGGLVFASTIGIEMAARGMAVICGGNAFFATCPAVEVPESGAAYAAAVLRLAGLAPGTRFPERRRLAYRFLSSTCLRGDTPLPQVRMPTPYHGEIAYDSLDALAQGVDPGLDRVCRVILEDAPVYPPPAGRSDDVSAEDVFFAGLDAPWKDEPAARGRTA